MLVKERHGQAHVLVVECRADFGHRLFAHAGKQDDAQEGEEALDSQDAQQQGGDAVEVAQKPVRFAGGHVHEFAQEVGKAQEHAARDDQEEQSGKEGPFVGQHEAIDAQKFAQVVAGKRFFGLFVTARLVSSFHVEKDCSQKAAAKIGRPPDSNRP